MKLLLTLILIGKIFEVSRKDLDNTLLGIADGHDYIFMMEKYFLLKENEKENKRYDYVTKVNMTAM